MSHEYDVTTNGENTSSESTSLLYDTEPGLTSTSRPIGTTFPAVESSVANPFPFFDLRPPILDLAPTMSLQDYFTGKVPPIEQPTRKNEQPTNVSSKEPPSKDPPPPLIRDPPPYRKSLSTTEFPPPFAIHPPSSQSTKNPSFSIKDHPSFAKESSFSKNPHLVKDNFLSYAQPNLLTTTTNIVTSLPRVPPPRYETRTTTDNLQQRPTMIDTPYYAYETSYQPIKAHYGWKDPGLRKSQTRSPPPYTPRSMRSNSPYALTEKTLYSNDGICLYGNFVPSYNFSAYSSPFSAVDSSIYLYAGGDGHVLRN